MRVRFMSYNIQHGLDFQKRVIDLDLMADTVRALGADFCGLNEVRGKGRDGDYTDQAKAIADRLGWHWYFAEAIRFNGTNPYGNAFVSRFPIISAEKVMIPDPPVKDEDTYYETRCAIKAVIDVGGEKVTVLVVHFGLANSEQKNAVATLCEQAAKIDGRLIVMGDFNAEPDNPVLKPLYEVVEDTGKLLPAGLKSWDSIAPKQKLDYILSRNIRQLSASIPQIVTSDHCPYVADFEI